MYDFVGQPLNSTTDNIPSITNIPNNSTNPTNSNGNPMNMNYIPQNANRLIQIENPTLAQNFGKYLNQNSYLSIYYY